MQTVRSYAFRGFVVLWILVMGLTIPYLALRRDPAMIRAVSRIWSRGITSGLRWICGLDFREIGLENKPSEPAIYACNHQSYWEALAFNIMVLDIAIVLKKSLLSAPVAGWFLRHSPMIAVDREHGARSLREMLQQARSTIAEGRSILIFPEGTFQNITTRVSFKPGVAALYRALNVAVVPVAVDSGVFWRGHEARVGRGTVTVSYLPPIAPGLPVDSLVMRLEDVIYTERDRLLCQRSFERTDRTKSP
jgi:1-acyl-sn-glycerol-3-phosphate acyltransferase